MEMKEHKELIVELAQDVKEISHKSRNIKHVDNVRM